MTAQLIMGCTGAGLCAIAVWRIYRDDVVLGAVAAVIGCVLMIGSMV